MENTRYGKFITHDCYSVTKPDGSHIYSTRQLPDWGNGNFSIDCALRFKPQIMIDKPHKHTYDQYLCFFGTNEADLHEFEAEIEIYLGEEQEKHVISTPSVVCVSAGLIHGPVIWTRVDKPVLFVDIAMTNKYVRTVVPLDSKKE